LHEEAPNLAVALVAGVVAWGASIRRFRAAISTVLEEQCQQPRDVQMALPACIMKSNHDLPVP